MRGKTVDLAKGRWREILPVMGISKEFLTGKHLSCPLCGGVDRFRFDDLEGRGTYFCNGCGAGNGFVLIMKLKGWDFKTAADEIDKIIGNLPKNRPAAIKPRFVESNSRLNSLWRDSRQIVPKCPVDLYLRKRGIVIDGKDYADVLRYMPRLKHTNGQHYPGMLAKWFDAGGTPQQIQRSYYTKEGDKASAIPHRMLMQREIAEGGAVRLGDAAKSMGIAEGVETALSAAQLTGLVVWSTLTAGLLKTWKPPASAEHIIVFGDNDQNGTGQAAAWELVRRLRIESERLGVKRTIEVRLPERDKDWNDVLVRLREHAA